MRLNLIKNQDAFQVTCKAVNEIVEDDKVTGIEIEGYASTKDKDRVKDIVEPNAFKSALDLYMTNPIVLLQHNADKPIWIVTDATIDSKGLYIKARITEDTDWVFSKLKNKVLRAFSIGYRIKDYEIDEVKDDQGDVTGYEQIIKDLELFEISLVSIPANPYALTKSMSNCFEEVKDEVVEEPKEEEKVEEEEEKVEAEVESKNTEEVKEEEKEVEVTPYDEENDDKVNTEEVEEEIEEEEEEKVEEVEEKNEEEVENKEEEKEEAIEESEEPKEESVNTTEIEESTEEVDWSENVSETETECQAEEDEVIEKAIDLKELSRKSIEQFIDAKSLAMKKELEDKIAEKDAKIQDLSEKLGLTQELLKECVNVLTTLDSAVKSTVIKTGYSYEQPVKKANGYSRIVDLAKSI